MKRSTTQSYRVSGSNHAATFEAVFDSRKRKVIGLWRRGDRYYGQLRVDLGNGRTAPRRIPIQAGNLDEAKAALERIRTERRAGSLPTTGHRPKFDDFAGEYSASVTLARKKMTTQLIERQAINRWITHLGGIRLDKITAPMIHSYREQRLALGRTPRTVNLDTVAVRNVLKLMPPPNSLDIRSSTRHEKAEKPTVVVNITRGNDDLHAASMAIGLASDVIKAGRHSVIFLNVHAPVLAKADLPPEIKFADFRPVKEMLARFLAAGGRRHRVWPPEVCALQ